MKDPLLAMNEGVEFTNRPKCEHTLEQSYSGMYSIFQQKEHISAYLSNATHNARSLNM